MVDTASRTEALALAQGDWTVQLLVGRTPRGHSSRLLPAIEEQLGRQGWEPATLDGLGVVLGPGSFTGIRVGIATVAGLARGLSVPAFGFDALRVRAMALGFAEPIVVPILDARRGEVYAAAYRGATEICAPCACAPRALAERLVRIVEREDAGGEATLLACGGGARLYRDLLREILGHRLILAAGQGDVPGVAQAAVEVAARVARGERPGADDLKPFYLRPSQAERSAE